MRRSTVVKLTFLPMLASAVVAADPPPIEPTTSDPSGDPTLSPPGMTEPDSPDPMLSPPGMTPTADECWRDPEQARCDASYRDQDVEPTSGYGGGSTWIVRGGFGHYFWSGG